MFMSEDGVSAISVNIGGSSSPGWKEGIFLSQLSLKNVQKIYIVVINV